MPRSQTPPHSKEAEMEILGAILKDPASLDEIVYSVKPTDFYVPKHRTIYNTCVDLYHKGLPCDTVTVADGLGEDNLKTIGGRVYLVELTQFNISSSRIKHHVSILKEKSTARTLLKTVSDITQGLYSGDKNVGELLLEAEDSIFKLTEAVAENRFIHISEAIPDVLKDIEDYQSGEAFKNLITTGFADVDYALGGFLPGQLIVIASNTGHGKTQFALQVLENNAKRGKAGAIFALEMTAKELVVRSLAKFSNISSDLFRREKAMTSEQWDKLTKASGSVGALPIYIDDSPILTTTEIISKSRKIKAKSKIELLVVDYTQLMKGKGENRNLEIADVTRTLKIVAKDISVPVIAISQLTRDNAKQTRRPRLSDLRDSGAIEQDANKVLFPYHEPVGKDGEDNVVFDSMLIVGKNREGSRPASPIHLEFKNGIWYDKIPDYHKDLIEI